MAQIREVPGMDGTFEVVGLGLKFRLNEWRSGSIYDSAQTPATIQAGTKLYLFRDVQDKNLQHNNMDNNAGRMPAHTELIANRIGAHVAQAIGDLLVSDADIIKIGHAAVLELFFNGDRKVSEGPLYTQPSGYGYIGSTTRTDTGVVGPTGTSVRELLVAQHLKPNDSIRGEVTFYDNQWLAKDHGQGSFPSTSYRVVITCHLDGLLKKLATR